MFSDLFARVPLERLKSEHTQLQRQELNPEVYISGAAVRQLSAIGRRRFERLLAAFAGHTLHAPFLDLAPGALDDDVRDLTRRKLDRVMEAAAQWGSRLVVMHFNYDPVYYRGYFPGWLERAAELFRGLAASGPRIALENISEPTPAVYLQLAECIGSDRIIPCFDFGHHRVFATVSFEKWLRALRPCRRIHFHLHDNDGDRDSHLPLGQGRIDWVRAKRAMASLGADFSVTLESHTPRDLDLSLAYYRRHFL